VPAAGRRAASSKAGQNPNGLAIQGHSDEQQQQLTDPTAEAQAIRDTMLTDLGEFESFGRAHCTQLVPTVVVGQVQP
jgi:hypothetical protein